MAQLKRNAKSTGRDQNNACVDFTKLNHYRMKRWNKTLHLSENMKRTLARLNRKFTWMGLTESWCGDADPSLPVMHHLASLNPNTSLKILIRDEHLELMAQFMTEGAMSIPKLIAFDDKTMPVFGEWGPRPQ